MDGTVAVTVGNDGLVRWWDLKTGSQIRAVELRVLPDGYADTTFRLSKDGRRLAAWVNDKVVIWDTETGRVTASISMATTPFDIALSADGSAVAVVERGPQVTVHWPGTSRHRVFPLKASDPESVVARLLCQFSRDGRRLFLFGNFNPGLVVFDTADGREVFSASDWKGLATLSGDGEILAVYEPRWMKDRIPDIRLTNLATGKVSRPSLVDPDPEDGMLMLAPGGRLLARVGERQTCLFDVVSGKLVHRLDVRASVVNFSSDGRLVASTGDAPRLRVWDVATGRELNDRPGVFDERSAVSPDGRFMAVDRSDRIGSKLDLWDLQRGIQLRKLPAVSGWLGPLAFSADGRTLSACEENGRLRCWAVRTGVMRPAVPIDLGDEGRPEVSADGRRVAAVVPLASGTALCTWDATTGRLLRRHSLPSSLAEFRDCAWSPDGSAVLLPPPVVLDVRRLGEVPDPAELIDVESGPPGVRIPLEGRPEFSADGRLVAGWSILATPNPSGRMKVWEAASGKAVASINAPDYVFDYSALDIELRALILADGRVLRVVDLATGADRGRIKPPGDVRGRKEWSPITELWVVANGRQLVTTMKDGTAVVWDLSAFPPPPLADKHGEPELRAWWDELAGDDAAKAYAAGWKLSESPAGEVVAFLRERLRPARGIDRDEARKRIADLDSPVFATREAASRRLQQMGPAVLPYLRHPPAGMSVEAGERLQVLVRRLSDPVPSAETLRVLRAVAVLERVGTDDARKVLDDLARGAADAPETKAASSALGRMWRGWSR
jgi:WD40 repeat protein